MTLVDMEGASYYNWSTNLQRVGSSDRQWDQNRGGGWIIRLDHVVKCLNMLGSMQTKM